MSFSTSAESNSLAVSLIKKDIPKTGDTDTKTRFEDILKYKEAKIRLGLHALFDHQAAKDEDINHSPVIVDIEFIVPIGTQITGDLIVEYNDAFLPVRCIPHRDETEKIKLKICFSNHEYTGEYRSKMNTFQLKHPDMEFNVYML